jgi:hypothetical protein
MPVNHIVTPLDSAVLDSKEQYIFYHKMVDFVFKELIVRVQRQNICTHKELTFFKQYSDVLLYSIEAMRIKYMYDDEDNMKIDLTESGFPNYLEFRYLYNDLQLKHEHLNKLSGVHHIKAEFLDTLLRKKQPIKRDRLFQAASIIYYSTVQEKYIFNRFIQGKIVAAPHGSEAEFLVSWSFYDVGTNRPYVCYMYFDYTGKLIENDREKIYDVLKKNADRLMEMDFMSYTIDKKLVHVQPKKIKRIDVGPLHNVFAKDKNAITHSILSGIAKKEIPLESYVMSFKVDEVLSEDTFKEGGFFSRQVLQKWNTLEQKKYILAPHRVIQLLHNQVPRELDNLALPPIQMADLKIEV